MSICVRYSLERTLQMYFVSICCLNMFKQTSSRSTNQCISSCYIDMIELNIRNGKCRIPLCFVEFCNTRFQYVQDILQIITNYSHVSFAGRSHASKEMEPIACLFYNYKLTTRRQTKQMLMPHVFYCYYSLARQSHNVCTPQKL